ncbi:radical SAM protein [Paenibacillus ginsengihumi]|uniref:radical SAM protein n=1 Tax=Paenibacillus ginsengihumi TaxID=431596 RepID=UPI00037BA71B|nr:radical SAM protein [Paenibacillus ginsengihumi]
MLAFYPRFIRTFDDLPGYTSLLIHSWNGCNMRCFGCHNSDELIAKKPDGRHLDGRQVIDRLQGCRSMFEAVLFSGGEFLINEYSEIADCLREVRAVYDGKIIVFTNGTYPRKLQQLFDDKLIDGAHIDMKLPYHALDPAQDREIYEAVIGIAPSETYCKAILESVEIVIRHNSDVSQVRTVRYPILSEHFFDEIRIYVDKLKDKYNSRVPYFINPYHPPYQASTP